ncbi:MAG TPA: hypothetical protein VIG90_00385 [Pedomonas sp.]|uniref:hypothetical protein n=1 Tax=Pedomonas sp. TaxID=2976421 RepID=UPI002F4186FA
MSDNLGDVGYQEITISVPSDLTEKKVNMDVLHFVSSMTSSLAWPLLILLLFCMFKRKIEDLLDNINEIGWGDKNFKFKRKLNEVEESVLLNKNEDIISDQKSDAENNVQNGGPEPKEGSMSKDEAPRTHKVTPNSINISTVITSPSVDHHPVQSELSEKLMDEYPVIEIINDWARINDILNKLITSLNPSPSYAKLSPMRKVGRLRRAGIIDDSMEYNLREMMYLRNIAAHSAGITATDALRYKKLSGQIYETLTSKLKNN